MLSIRVKMGPPRSKEWTCCFGLHVHTATIMIGLWHLFLNILALSLLAVIIRNPDMMHELENSYEDPVDHDAPALPTPLSKIDPPYAYRDHSLNYHNVDMGGLVCICMIAITLMMIYGAIKGKPSHLLPFFCLQLFDFAITTLTAAGYLCYLQSIHRLIAESHRLPWREKLLQLSPDALVMVVLIAFVSIVLLKAYAIGIVWRCYKYLTMRQHNLRSMLPYILPHVSATQGGSGNGFGSGGQERDYSTLLPDYEEAIAQSMKQPPPPSYQVAVSNLQAVEAIAAAEANNNNNNDDNNNESANLNDTPNSVADNNNVTTTPPPPPYSSTTGRLMAAPVSALAAAIASVSARNIASSVNAAAAAASAAAAPTVATTANTNATGTTTMPSSSSNSSSPIRILNAQSHHQQQQESYQQQQQQHQQRNESTA